ncbi:phage terminase, small subunit, putative, P27 family [Kaistia soli DSM 19436]|uniref:Phage terminase, small subunit, putative, P27 family n=1 Tax=Kaistia soli DSM 19436 TaxID=1122133 RepID=A0A1M5PQQ3_9HYPH|nr:phage terminase small subunit P27 family [Kaistia soli]SHH03653.1 phage terminase, small subunit, putative, P27 family [Kaistia soli DSM 19436]
MRGRKPSAIVAGSSAVTGIPKPPAWLGKHARAEWRRIMPDLVARKILDEADMGGVENYCVAMGRVRDLELEIQKAGAIDPVLFRMADKAMQTARQLAAEYGLTPVSRSRPAIRADDLDDGADDLALE